MSTRKIVIWYRLRFFVFCWLSDKVLSKMKKFLIFLTETISRTDKG